MSELIEVLNEYSELGIAQQLDYAKFYLYSIITHSTAIEGSTVTEIENQLMFDEGISSNKPIAEQLMNLDLKKAYERAFSLADNNEDFSEELLCELSGILMHNTGALYNTIAGTFDSSKGELRLLNVSAGRGGKSYLAWQKVPDRLNKFCAWINEEREKLIADDIERIYRLSFEAHYRLVCIHPWADGNGRMARLVMNMIQREFGVVPAIVKKDRRAEYIKSLADSQSSDDAAVFIAFMMKHHEDNIKAQIIEYRESLKNDTLNTENDTLNETINLTDKERAVYTEIKRDTRIKIEELVNITGFSRATVTRAIESLKTAGLIERVGSKKTGSWRINNDIGRLQQ